MNFKYLLNLLKKTLVQKRTTNSINEPIHSEPITEQNKEVEKTEQVDISIRKSIVDKFVATGKDHLKSCGAIRSIPIKQKSQMDHNKIKGVKDFRIKTNNIKVKEIKDKKNYLEKKEVDEDKCRFCQKATVIAVSCEECGHPTPKVMCDNDITNGVSRLRNPYIKKCVNSLD